MSDWISSGVGMENRKMYLILTLDVDRRKSTN